MVSRSPTFMLALPLSFLLGGCAATNNYDNTSNPFDELEQRPPLSSGFAISPASPQGPSTPPIQKPSSASSGGEMVGAVAIAIPAGQDRPIETQGGAVQASPHIQDMIAEANRLGNMGDYQGKAELLSQAGYSGSSEAFMSSRGCTSMAPYLTIWIRRFTSSISRTARGTRKQPEC